MKRYALPLCLICMLSLLLTGCIASISAKNDAVAMDKEAANALYAAKAKESASLVEYIDALFVNSDITDDTVSVKVYDDSNSYINNFSDKFTLAINAYCKEKYGACSETIDGVTLKYVTSTRNNRANYAARTSAWEFSATEHRQTYEQKDSIVREEIRRALIAAKRTRAPYMAEVPLARGVRMTVSLFDQYVGGKFSYTRQIHNTTNTPYTIALGDLGAILCKGAVYAIAYQDAKIDISGQGVRTGDSVTLNPGTECTISMDVTIAGLDIYKDDALSLRLHNKTYSFPKNPTVYSVNAKHYDELAKKYGL